MSFNDDHLLRNYYCRDELDWVRTLGHVPLNSNMVLVPFLFISPNLIVVSVMDIMPMV